MHQVLVKVKIKGLDTCYSAAYTSQTRDQQRFTISEVAADWHEPMVPRSIMWPSIARANGQLDLQSATLGLHPVYSHSYYSFSHLAEGRRLSWPDLTVC